MGQKMHKTKVELPACNYCGSTSKGVKLDNLTSWEHVGKFTIVKCNNCGLLYLYPRPKKDLISRYYPKKSYWGHDVKASSVEVNFKIERDKVFGNVYRWILKHKKKGRILDIGSGTGIFLTKFKELGWSTEGNEISKEAVDFSKRKFAVGLTVGDFLDLKIYRKNFYDVVTLNNSLEHLYEPSKTLLKSYDVLRKGGIIEVTVPNTSSIGFLLLGRDWQALQPPRHLYHFTPYSLIRMLKKNGFTVVYIDYWDWAHNFYTVFESFRYKLSPRFAKKSSGGLIKARYEKKIYPRKELGKIIIKIASLIIVIIGSFLKRSEVITVYAIK